MLNPERRWRWFDKNKRNFRSEVCPISKRYLEKKIRLYSLPSYEIFELLLQQRGVENHKMSNLKPNDKTWNREENWTKWAIEDVIPLYLICFFNRLLTLVFKIMEHTSHIHILFIALSSLQRPCFQFLVKNIWLYKHAL